MPDEAIMRKNACDQRNAEVLAAYQRAMDDEPDGAPGWLSVERAREALRRTHHPPPVEVDQQAASDMMQKRIARLMDGEPQAAETGGDPAAALTFAQRTFYGLVAKAGVNLLVKVMAVTTNGGDSLRGFVDVAILPDVAGALKGCSAFTVRGLAYLRLPSGPNGITEPVVGDVGMAQFCQWSSLYLGPPPMSGTMKHTGPIHFTHHHRCQCSECLAAGTRPGGEALTEEEAIPLFKTVKCDSGVYLAAKPPAPTRTIPARALNRGPQRIGLFTL